MQRRNNYQSKNSSLDPAIVQVLKDVHETKERQRKRCLQPGDGSVIFGLLAITAFCLGYYFTRDKKHIIAPIQRYVTISHAKNSFYTKIVK